MSADSTPTESKAKAWRGTPPRQDRAKFRAVLLYLLGKLQDRRQVGETSLHKLLYFIDFDHYELEEEPLMGLRYIRNLHGPTARMFKAWTEEMERDGLLKILEGEEAGQPRKRYLPSGSGAPGLDERERRHIDAVVRRLEQRTDLSAGQLEALSHKDVPWIGAKPGEDLDYEAVFYRTADTALRTDYSESGGADAG